MESSFWELHLPLGTGGWGGLHESPAWGSPNTPLINQGLWTAPRNGVKVQLLINYILITLWVAKAELFHGRDSTEPLSEGSPAAPPGLPDPSLQAPPAREKDWDQRLRNLLPALLPSEEVTLQLQEFPCLAGSPSGAGLWRALGDFNKSHFPAIECSRHL